MNDRARNLLTVLALPLRVYLGLVFILASLYKIAEPAEFALSIATYEILPLGLVNLMALLLPWIELLIGVTLILGFWTRASALVIAGMMILFIAALAIALSKDLQMSCGCFASSETGDEISALTMLRDSAWLVASGYVLWVDDGRFGLDGWLRRIRHRPHLDNSIDPGSPTREN
jgi:putative oxidoreductase